MARDDVDMIRLYTRQETLVAAPSCTGWPRRHAITTPTLLRCPTSSSPRTRVNPSPLPVSPAITATGVYVPVVVHPKWRGRGLQRELIRARIKWLRDKQVSRVNVWASPTNVYSLNNLVTEGFRFVAEKPREFKGTMHLKLRKTL